jgi:hypothetical protein
LDVTIVDTGKGTKVTLEEAIGRFVAKAERLEKFRFAMTNASSATKCAEICPDTIKNWAYTLNINSDENVLLTVATRFAEHFYGMRPMNRDYVLIGNIIGFDGRELAPSNPSDSSVQRWVPGSAFNSSTTRPKAESGSIAAPRKEGAVKKVWDIASTMPDASRSAVVAECVRQGININTAKTQVQRWGAAQRSTLNK